jgi:predicted nucleic acid-binding protein
LAGITDYPLSDAVVDRSIELRRSRKMPLPDAIIAATALENDIPLVTRNTKDFRHIPDLEIVNPFDDF